MGIGAFFGADATLLVRAQPFPEHAPTLARALGISLVGQDDLDILSKTYSPPGGAFDTPVWDNFFSPETVSNVIALLRRLPDPLRPVTLYRLMRYWMQPTHLRLTRSIAALRPMAAGKTRGTVAELVFADYVWLYAVALWEACEALVLNGLSRLKQGLQLYLSGDEVGLQNLQRITTAVENITRNVNPHASLGVFPPYFDRFTLTAYWISSLVV